MPGIAQQSACPMAYAGTVTATAALSMIMIFRTGDDTCRGTCPSRPRQVILAIVS